MRTCEKCKREFPDYLVDTLQIIVLGDTEAVFQVCPVCALELGNRAFPETPRTGFRKGSRAQRLLEDCRLYLSNGGGKA